MTRDEELRDWEAKHGELRPRVETLEEEEERKRRELWERWRLET